MYKEIKKTKREKLKIRFKVVRLAHSIVMSSFDEIYDFNEFMKSAIKKEKSQSATRLEKGAIGLEKEELDLYWDYFAEDCQKIGSVFEKLALESFVVMIYSRVETGMATLCDAIRQDKQKETGDSTLLRYSDLRGSGYLDQAKLYMEKVLGIDLELRSNPQWPEIMALKTLRNAIVHEKGQLKTKNSTLKKHIKHGFIELRNQNVEKEEISGSAIVKATYIDYILPEIRKFFQDIKI
ncbi:MAG: hypothetical protein JEZ11_10240 [Desulfobacterales bacterium]|nr:hypothetical protein [Desulfobacterales bacterium]